MAVGPSRRRQGQPRPRRRAGSDVVIYSKYGGTEVKYNGEEYLILSPATCWPSSTDDPHHAHPTAPCALPHSGTPGAVVYPRPDVAPARMRRLRRPNAAPGRSTGQPSGPLRRAGSNRVRAGATTTGLRTPMLKGC
ncbi:hypothetical protein [Saccharopolyspora gregorii]|uniref:hypothetical protein n=1 Tax=Saccharopolyspora gregorii TaxID=33914 RepID=UPI003CD0A6B6